MLSNVTVCVIGSGAAGLITAHTLLNDNFDVQILTRDSSPGGVWSAEKIYPGLRINKYVLFLYFSIGIKTEGAVVYTANLISLLFPCNSQIMVATLEVA